MVYVLSMDGQPLMPTKRYGKAYVQYNAAIHPPPKEVGVFLLIFDKKIKTDCGGKMQEIYTEKAPKPIGPYSQAVKYENLLFISGQIAINPSSNEFVNADIATQTKIIMENIKAILEEAGFNMNHIIKTTIYLKNINDFQIVNEIYSKYFKEHKPARSTVEVSRLPKDALVEIEVIAGS